MNQEWNLEELIVATEVIAYMAEIRKHTGRAISLEQAYEDKGVPYNMRLTRYEIERIIEELLEQ